MAASVFLGNFRITSEFRSASRPDHNGVDLVGDENKTVHSVCDGIVDLVQNWNFGDSKSGMMSYGRLVIIKGTDSRYYYYAHLDSFNLAKGQEVKAGQAIGIMGNTGNSFGAHVHFEVRNSNKKSISPFDILGIPNKKGKYVGGVANHTKGWRKNEKGWWYERSDKTYCKNEWLKDYNRWYYFDENGYAVTGFKVINGKTYYFAEVAFEEVKECQMLQTDAHGALV